MIRSTVFRLRRLFAVTLLTLTLVAGVAGTAEPAAALPMSSDSVEWLCDVGGGDLTTQYIYSSSTGFQIRIFCNFPSGYQLYCSGLWSFDCVYL